MAIFSIRSGALAIGLALAIGGIGVNAAQAENGRRDEVRRDGRGARVQPQGTVQRREVERARGAAPHQEPAHAREAERHRAHEHAREAERHREIERRRLREIEHAREAERRRRMEHARWEHEQHRGHHQGRHGGHVMSEPPHHVIHVERPSVAAAPPSQPTVVIEIPVKLP